MTRRRRARRALALAVIAALLAACTSDDGTGGSDSTPEGADGTTTAPSPPTTTDRPEATIDIPADPTALAAETYVAGYPLVVSVRTMQRLGGLLGVNRLTWQSALAGPESRVIVAPNRDTLYSVAVLDLRREPVVLTLPEITDRYFTYQLLDAWTESFAYIGTRATAGEAGSWAIVAPGWEGELPDGVERIEASTPQVFLLGRYLVDDEADIANVTAISQEASLVPLSTVTGAPPAPAPPPLGDARGSAQDIPTDASFYDELMDAVAINPPSTPAQQDLFAAAEERLGLAPGEDVDPSEVLDAGATAGDARIDEGLGARGGPVGGWTTQLDIGTYGDDIDLRAVVARAGWGANVPEEAVYPVARVDADGQPLSGEHTYRLRFPADALPPVDAFWSLSVYGPDLFFVEHPSGRYTIGDRSPDLVLADDGSLEIILSPTEPGPDAGAVSWLPTPSEGFGLMLRLYLPQQSVLDGDWQPPPLERVD